MGPESLEHLYPVIVPLIPALPVLAFLITILCGGWFLHHRTAWLTIGAMAVSTVLAWGFVFLPVLGGFLGGGGHEAYHWSHDWYWAAAGPEGFGIKIGVMVDHLTAAMLAMVTLVVLLIEIYSVGYMHGEAHYSRFHSYVSLFASGMLGLVVSNNYLTLLVSWEIMGLCSYLLIGFWYHKDSARKAAKKAFMVTRVGDMGMLLGIILAFAFVGSFGFQDIFSWAGDAVTGKGGLSVETGRLVVCLIALGLFMGSVGKSAQFPLHVWLPDAMEGPTPVSALIHAATMVSAGVYLVARSFPLMYGVGPTSGHLTAQFTVDWLGFLGSGSPAWAHRLYTLDPLLTVAWVGGITVLLGATIAVFQSDIKKVLAYSTISQLGYMMLGLGVGGYTAACFHLLTHAFFKALLFLGSGSVIHAVEHAMHHEHVHEDPQNMFNMGGLWKKMPVTAWTFLIGTLALSGVPPFAGFFSKDEILLEAMRGAHGVGALGVMGMLGAFLTAFYMTRLCMLTFFVRPRFANVLEHTEDSPRTMTVPLMVLAAFAAVMGLPALPAFLGGHNVWHSFINVEPLVEAYGLRAAGVLEPDLGIALLSTLFAFSGIALGYLLYGTRDGGAARRMAWGNPLSRALMLPPKRLYWMDTVLYTIFVRPLFVVMDACNAVDRYVIDLTVNLVGWLTLVLSNLGRWIDLNVVDGIVNGLGWGTKTTGEVGKFLQSGKVQGYTLLAVVGLLLVIALRVVLLGGA